MADILFFNQVREEDFPIIGEKAKKLSMLSKSGFRIPPGFIVTKNALNDTGKGRLVFLEETQDEITDAYLSLSVSLDKTSVASLLSSEEVYVAVRGNQKTALNVKGNEQLIKTVLASFSEGSEAVIVQKMVDSEKSGVAFMSNKDIIITACFGLGEGLDSGFIFPDSYVIDKNTSALKGIKIGEKNYAYIRDTETKTTVKQELGNKSKQQVLEENELNEISTQLKRITKFFAKEQKIEWSIKKGVLYILQSKDNTNDQPERVEFEITETEEHAPAEKIDIQQEEEFIFEPEPEKTRKEKSEELEIVHLDSVTGKKEEQDEVRDENPEEIMIKQEEEPEDEKDDDSIFSSYKGIKDEPKQGVNRIAELAKLNAGNAIVYCHIAVKEKLKERLLRYTKIASDDFTEILDELIQYENMEDELKYRKLDKAAKDFMVKMRYPQPEEVEMGLRMINDI
jgi:phosphoenolpyruvate synthase/pyruvate phosphate dikinase